MANIVDDLKRVARVAVVYKLRSRVQKPAVGALCTNWDRFDVDRIVILLLEQFSQVVNSVPYLIVGVIGPNQDHDLDSVVSRSVGVRAVDNPRGSILEITREAFDAW